jgi:hypothetical protein
LCKHLSALPIFDPTAAAGAIILLQRMSLFVVQARREVVEMA